MCCSCAWCWLKRKGLRETVWGGRALYYMLSMPQRGHTWGKATIMKIEKFTTSRKTENNKFKKYPSQDCFYNEKGLVVNIDWLNCNFVWPPCLASVMGKCVVWPYDVDKFRFSFFPFLRHSHIWPMETAALLWRKWDILAKSVVVEEDQRPPADFVPKGFGKTVAGGGAIPWSFWPDCFGSIVLAGFK